MIWYGITIALVLLLILLPIIIYTFLIFPNFDGVMRNIHWYTYDDKSQHYLYWTGFWVIVLFGTRSVANGSNKNRKSRSSYDQRWNRMEDDT